MLSGPPPSFLENHNDYLSVRGMSLFFRKVYLARSWLLVPSEPGTSLDPCSETSLSRELFSRVSRSSSTLALEIEGQYCIVLHSAPANDMTQSVRELVLLLTSMAICSYFLYADADQHVSAEVDRQDRQQGDSDELETNDGKLSPIEGNKFMTQNGTVVELFPVSGPIFQLDVRSRRRLGDFMSCGSCNCCDPSKKFCRPSPCCYNINCNVQPFGTCKLQPFSCNCNGCGM